MAETSIEWAHYTFNLWEGCAKVSPACANCYAAARDVWLHNGENWGPSAPRLFHNRKAYWDQIWTWDRLAGKEGLRRRVFCGSLMDIFELHQNPNVRSLQHEARARLWHIIERTHNLDWLLLTKRPENGRDCLPVRWTEKLCQPPENVWIGVTAEDQIRADQRIPELLSLPASRRFVSCEPLLRPLTLRHYLHKLDWVIVGCESAPGKRPGERLMLHDWVVDLRDQCVTADVAFFLKQMVCDGELQSTPELDGKRWIELPPPVS